MIDIEEYELYLIENEIAANTIKNYINNLEYLNCFLAKNNIKQIDKKVLVRFKNHLKEKEYHPGKRYTTGTINQKITCLNIYFNWKYPKSGSNLKLKLEKEQLKDHRESITKIDFKRLLRHANDEMYLFILVIANTGLRITEVCQLKKRDLNSVGIKIHNKRKDRTIALPPFLKKKLVIWVNKRKLEEGDFLFSKSQTWYRVQLKKIAGKAKVNKSKVYPHSIRHYFSKQFISNGGDSTDLQQMLGHADIKTTTIYTKKNKSEIAELFKRNKNK